MARLTTATLAIFDLLCRSSAITYGTHRESVNSWGGRETWPWTRSEQQKPDPIANVIGGETSKTPSEGAEDSNLNVEKLDLGVKQPDIDTSLKRIQASENLRDTAEVQETPLAEASSEKNKKPKKSRAVDDEEDESPDSPEISSDATPRVLKRTRAMRNLNEERNQAIDEEANEAEEHAPKTKRGMANALKALCKGGMCGKGKSSKDQEENGVVEEVSEEVGKKVDELLTPPPKNPHFFIGGAWGTAPGIASGFYAPLGTLGVTPLKDAAITGALAGGAIGVMPAFGSINEGQTFGERVYNPVSTVVGAASYGAGLAVGVNAIKKEYLKSRGAQCTPLPVQDNFNILQYISATWYPQYQNPQQFQKGDQINCGNATYTAKTGGLWGWDVDVTNMGYGISTNSGFLCAEQQQGAKLVVGPCMVPTSMGSPYWVLNYSESAGHAIVMGGQPEKYNSATGKCGYSRDMDNGMWIFSRAKLPSTAQMAVIEGLKDYLENDLNVDTSAMVRVDQVNC